MSVQNDIAADTGKAFDRPINVSVIEKATKFPFLQELGFNGQLGHAKDMFHGLKDFNKQLDKYSSTDGKLKIAWNVIKQIAPVNPEVAKNLFKSGSLGQVGSAFKKLVGFDQVFSVSMDELKQNPEAVASKLA